MPICLSNITEIFLTYIYIIELYNTLHNYVIYWSKLSRNAVNLFFLFQVAIEIYYKKNSF